MAKALEDIKVLGFNQAYVGSIYALFLRQLGAQVITEEKGGEKQDITGEKGL